MTPQAIFAICLWLLLYATSVCFYRTPGSLAAGLVFGWLFLPNFTVALSGFPDCNKSVLVSLVSIGLMFAVSNRRRPGDCLSWLDLPAFGVTLFSIPPSVANGLGLYDGLSAAYTNFWIWTAPYLIGRIVFGSHTHSVVLLRIIVLAGLIYAGFCLYEIKMSPCLHSNVYGMRPRGDQNYFLQAVRYGMWRPTVFMEHGLALAIFMSITSTLAWWAYVSGVIPRMVGMSTSVVAAILGLTTLLCVSSGAIALMVLGWGFIALRSGKFGRLALITLALIPFAYPVTRILGNEFFVNAADSIVEVAAKQTGDSRARSFETRVDNETRILRKWKFSPLFGSASRFMDMTGFEDAKSVTVDSVWIIMLGKFGLCGWLSWTTLLGLPAVFVSFHSKFWSSGKQSTALELSLASLLFLFDCLLNAVPNPLFVVISGASVGLIGHGLILDDGRELQSGVKTVVSPRVARALWPPKHS